MQAVEKVILIVCVQKCNIQSLLENNESKSIKKQFLRKQIVHLQNLHWTGVIGVTALKMIAHSAQLPLSFSQLYSSMQTKTAECNRMRSPSSASYSPT